MTDFNRTTEQSSMSSGSDLKRLHDCDDLQVADGYPDIRGWEVQTRDGLKLGKVHDLIVSPTQMRARYLDVDVKDQGHALVPVGTAQIDDEHDVVFVSGISADDLNAYPRYMRDSSADRTIDANYERTVRDRFVGSRPADMADRSNANDLDYDDDTFDDQRLFAGRRATGTSGALGDDRTQRLTVSEEQLEVGKRQVQAGEVELRKTVETQHVSEQVPLVHDEVTLERRPLDRNAVDASAISTDQEIRVPLMREEAVVDKRAVPREEIIVRKRLVTDTRTVEADLRRERLEVDGATDRVVDSAAGRTGSQASTRGNVADARNDSTNTDRRF